jgi:hypothetical protein
MRALCGREGDRQPRTMPRLTTLAALLLVVFATAACGGSESSASGCEEPASILFWGGSQWRELSEALARDPAECAEYYVTVPPEDSDKTRLRDAAKFAAIRTLGPHIHPVAEIRFTSETGWRAWVVGPHPDFAKGRTFFEAGVEARRRMAESRLDVAAGETWALNELSSEIRENVTGSRDEVREFLRGLHAGDGTGPDARGIVFDFGAALGVDDVEAYKVGLQSWLQDGEFWSAMDDYVDLFAEEVYARPDNWGVAGASLAERAAHLNAYFFHVPALADSGPESVEAAREFLRRAYVPLANAAWPHELIGETNEVSAETMARFVSTEVYAQREYAGDHPESVPPSSIGFGWAPNTAEPSYSDEGRDQLLERLARALRDTMGPKSDPAQACGDSGENTWCSGDVPGASFDEAWAIFTSWG